MDKDKIICSILETIEKGNDIPKSSLYNIEKDYFNEIIYSMQEDGLIEGVVFSKGGKGNKVLVSFLENANLTTEGKIYLRG